MGICLGTASGFKLNEKRGQDKIAARFFTMIGLEKYDVSCFYTVYAEMDLKRKGLINTDDLYYKYRCCLFTRFHIFNGTIWKYLEWFCSINYNLFLVCV